MTETKNVINRDRAYQLLQAALNSKPANYSYLSDHEFCVYLERDPESSALIPSCVVGKALSTAGVSFYRSEDGCLMAGVIDILVQYLKEANPGLEITPGAVILLTAAQKAQDSGVTYGTVAQILSSLSRVVPE